MKCPACGYVSLDQMESCKRCGAPMSASAAGPRVRSDDGPAAVAAVARETEPGVPSRVSEPPEPRRPAPTPTRPRRRRTRANPDARGTGSAEAPDDGALELGEEDLTPATASTASCAGMLLRVDDDLFGDEDNHPPTPAARGARPDKPEIGEPFVLAPHGPAFDLAGEALAAGDDDDQPVVDRDDEIPDRFWAPEIAGLGRRAGALLADQAILALLLGVFYGAAFLALRACGFDTDHFLSATGLRASLLPFALLAVVLSLSYQAFFHGYAGRTPGKALAGVEVRTADGAFPSRGRVLLRWFCATFSLAAAGLGIAWALIDPRRRGWADLLSGTVIARRRREHAGPDRR